MANAFSVLSLKRNRSASTSSKKESKMSAIFNKLANSFHGSKKRKQLVDQDYSNRRSSLSILIDYFRSSEEQDENDQKNNHPFANDALFEHNRYRQQKESNHSRNASLVNLQQNNQQQQLPQMPSIVVPVAATTRSILLKHNPTNSSVINIKPHHYHHRHTNSTPSATTARRKKASHVRHYSHVSCISSSNITVNSEDLTAKEFADIAGIRILSDDEDDSINTNEFSLSRKKICTHCGDDENNMPSLIVTSSNSSRISHRNNNSSILLRSSNSSVYNSYHGMILDYQDEEPQIWDNDFWQRPGEEKEFIKKSSLSTAKLEGPSILHELKQNVSLNQDTYIKKGRFEIHLSNNNNNISNRNSNMTEHCSADAASKSQKSNMVVEWKRKSRPTATSKHQVPA